MQTRTPLACRPLKNLYVAIYPLIENDRYLQITKNEFICEAFKNSGGSIDPKKAETLYNALISDAGLGPLL